MTTGQKKTLKVIPLKIMEGNVISFINTESRKYIILLKGVRKNIILVHL